jgi:hypothetical protein
LGESLDLLGQAMAIVLTSASSFGASS